MVTANLDPHFTLELIRVRLTLLVASSLISIHQAASAQVRASELATVSQVVDGARITVEYSRPAARERVLFGGLVRWGDVWTPGANWATTLEVDRDFRLAGQPVTKGKYAVWLIPRDSADWTLLLSTRFQAYHTQKPTQADEYKRITVKPESGTHFERLTFTFPTVSSEGAILQFHWGTAVLNLPLLVQPSASITLDAATAHAYVGEYNLMWQRRPEAVPMRVYLEGAKMRASVSVLTPYYDDVLELVPTGRDRFRPMFYRNGQPFDLEDWAIVFTVQNGRATTVEWRRITQEVVARGERIK